MLSGATITLRPADAGDLDLLGRWTRDPAFYPGVEIHHWTWRMTDLEAHLARKPNYNQHGWLMITPHGGSPVGWVVYRNFFGDDAPAALDIGYRMSPEHRGQGYATAATRLLVNQLFCATPINRIQSHTTLDNVASQRVMEKSGLTREGILRGLIFTAGRHHDVAMYSILRSDWSDADAYAGRYGGL
jgi:RimJ/RimL family protein N-acetyltransferase